MDECKINYVISVHQFKNGRNKRTFPNIDENDKHARKAFTNTHLIPP